jgi:hypothetical protein
VVESKRGAAKCEKGGSESVIGLKLVRRGQSLGESWAVLTSAKCEEGMEFCKDACQTDGDCLFSPL